MNLRYALSGPRLLTDADILASHFTLTRVPGEIEPFSIAGVQGWHSPNPHPVLSVAKWNTTDPDIAAAGLDQVLAMFRNAGRGFDWMTGPQDEALLPLLAAQGFVAPALSIAAMVRPINLDDRPGDDAGIVTRMMKGTRNDALSTIMAQGFDIPQDVARIYHNAYVAPSDLQHTDVYVAARTGEDHASGVAYLSYIGDGPMVLLRVAATLPAARGSGMYRSLIRHRLADAAEAGRQVAVVHAYSLASQNILADMGFVRQCDLCLHRWRP